MQQKRKVSFVDENANRDKEHTTEDTVQVKINLKYNLCLSEKITSKYFREIYQHYIE